MVVQWLDDVLSSNLDPPDERWTLMQTCLPLGLGCSLRGVAQGKGKFSLLKFRPLSVQSCRKPVHGTSPKSYHS